MLPYTTVLPKALLPVGERPIVAILLDQLAAAGVTRVDLCLGYLGELIRAYFAGSPPPPSVRVKYHHEQIPLGTAGPMSAIGDLDEPFLSLNGDVLTSLDFGDLLHRHEASDAALTIAVQQKETALSMGVIELDEGRVVSYREKPIALHVVSLGIYAWDPRALRYLGAGHADVPVLVDTLIAAGETVRAYPFSGAWFDIGTPEEHQVATADFSSNPTRYIRVPRGSL